MVKKGMKKASMFARVVYALAGIDGLILLGDAIFGWNLMVSPVGKWVLGIVGIVALINWLPVAITGKRNKDLFGLIGL